MKIFWLSFSLRGKNQGVCVVMADSNEEAKEKCINLGLYPENDDVACWNLTSMKKDPGIKFNRLYSEEEMIEMGYIPKEFD